MRNFPWIGTGLTLALWLMLGGAAFSGWWIAKSDGAREIAVLEDRLSTASGPSTCNLGTQAMDAKGDANETDTSTALAPSARGHDLRPAKAQYMHLRQMLTSR